VRLLPLARFFGGADVDVVSDGREEDYVTGADAETFADFAGERETRLSIVAAGIVFMGVS
jgi:hypothetical protein